MPDRMSAAPKFVKRGTTPEGKPFAVWDLPREWFPITVEGYGPDGSLLWSRTVATPEYGRRNIMDLPGNGPGSTPPILIKYGNGEIDEVRT